MNFKSIAKNLKKELSLNYDVKLTHVQEALAKSLGHRSRHSVIKSFQDRDFLNNKTEFRNRVDSFINEYDNFSYEDCKKEKIKVLKYLFDNLSIYSIFNLNDKVNKNMLESVKLCNNLSGSERIKIDFILSLYDSSSSRSFTNLKCLSKEDKDKILYILENIKYFLF